MSAFTDAFRSDLAAWLITQLDSVQLLGDDYAVGSDETLADIAGGDRRGSLTPINGALSYDSGWVVTDDPITTVAAVPSSPDDVGGVALIGPGATEADKRIVAYIDTRSDRTPIAITTDGGDIDVDFVGGRIMGV